MKKWAYYNEVDKHAAQWIRNLISAGHIAPGEVDERSIEDVCPDDVKSFVQCHWFAGIAGWSYALRQAGWPDDRPVWSGSCPCQGFSVAGKQKGFDDERHLWPAFHRLIRECKPSVSLGEQVASKAAEPWFDLVQTNLEALGYAFGCVAFPASSLGAPHIRDRAYWVGYASEPGLEGHTGDGDNQRGQERQDEEPGRPDAETGSDGWLADTASHRLSREGESAETETGWETRPHVGWQLSQRLEGRGVDSEQRAAVPAVDGDGHPRPTNGFWSSADWLRCRDGKWRAVEPGAFPLVNGPAGSVGQGCDISLPSAEGRKMRLKGYGNAIVAPQAKAFIECVMEIIG